MNHQGVALADVVEQRFKLRALRVLARRLVDEHLADLNAFKLSIRVLVERTDSYVTNPLSVHVVSQRNVYS